MKNKSKKSQCFVVKFALSLSSISFYSCSTNPLLTENVNPPEQIKLVEAMDRVSKDNGYPSNLSNFTYPTLDELLGEGHIKNKPLYLQNIKVLSDWITKDLSNKYRYQLSKNCDVLVGQFNNKFPLDESTIACAAWWIEKKNALIAQEKKFNALGDEPTIRMTDSQKKNWENFEDLSLGQSIGLIDLSSPAKVHFYVTNALHYASNCSLKNANAAVLFKLENYLPDPEIYGNIEKIYTKMEPCLVPNAEPSEKVHLRMGLLRLLKGNSELAFESLKKTQLEKEPKENSRNLFWLGTIFRKMNPTEALNPYWRQLVKENPLSLASLVANQQMGVDPMTLLVSDDKIQIQNRIEDGWTKENLESFIFENLLAIKKSDATNTWVNYVSKTISTTNPSLILYWAKTQNTLHNYYSSIQLFFRYNRYQKINLVSRGLLKLQFPRPYLQSIMSNNSEIDPIFTIALMRQESAFDENARSTANARGLMQLLPSTAKTLRKSVHPNDLYDPDINIELGAAYLEKLYKKYDGKSEYVLAAYNAGAMNLDKWLLRVPTANTMLFCDFIPYKESRSYISIILRNNYWYSRIFSEDTDNLSQKVLSKSKNSYYKSERVQALLSSISTNSFLTESQKTLLNKIYIFGNDSHLNALSLNSSTPTSSAR